MNIIHFLTGAFGKHFQLSFPNKTAEDIKSGDILTVNSQSEEKSPRNKAIVIFDLIFMLTNII